MVKLQVVMADNPPRREMGTGFHRPRPQPTSWLFLGEQLHALDYHLPALLLQTWLPASDTSELGILWSHTSTQS